MSGKAVVVGLLWLPAVIARWLAGGTWRCFCLAWARAHLGNAAVPLDNQILGLLDIEGTGRVRIGHQCRIYKHVRLETRDAGEIVIGDHVSISPGAVIVAHERVVIGSYAMIGEYCSIRDQDHRLDPDRPVRSAGYVTSPVVIGEDAWLGRGCAVLKGVTVGPRAVVGANSVVTRDVPAGEVWAGTPAKFLRARHPGEMVRAELVGDAVNVQ